MTALKYRDQERYKEKAKEYRRSRANDPRVKALKQSSQSRWTERNRLVIRSKQNNIRLSNKIRAISLLGNQCADCGHKYHPFIYDFHHLDPALKDSNIARLMNNKWENLETELLKCVLLCANCHRQRHIDDYET